MDATQALEELMQLSSQVSTAVVLGADGAVLASSSGDSAAADALARTTADLVAAASELGAQKQDVTRVEVELDEGGLFVVTESGLTVAAVTGPQPTSGLVVYDLRTCLRSIAEPEPKKTRAARKPKESST